mgnify:CR=1 FL=1
MIVYFNKRLINKNKGLKYKIVKENNFISFYNGPKYIIDKEKLYSKDVLFPKIILDNKKRNSINYHNDYLINNNKDSISHKGTTSKSDLVVTIGLVISLLTLIIVILKMFFM